MYSNFVLGFVDILHVFLFLSYFLCEATKVIHLSNVFFIWLTT
jgi:hypothetical protein